MGRIVEDLLLLARLDEGLPLAREPVEVELVLREALLRGMLLASREASVGVEPGVFALADADRLLQVLTNLVTNAIQHTPDGARLALGGRRAEGQVLLEVADSGPGIPPEDLPHVFSRWDPVRQQVLVSGPQVLRQEADCRSPNLGCVLARVAAAGDDDEFVRDVSCA